MKDFGLILGPITPPLATPAFPRFAQRSGSGWYGPYNVLDWHSSFDKLRAGKRGYIEEGDGITSGFNFKWEWTFSVSGEPHIKQYERSRNAEKYHENIRNGQSFPLAPEPGDPFGSRNWNLSKPRNTVDDYYAH